jgi:hypothetical protein
MTTDDVRTTRRRTQRDSDGARREARRVRRARRHAFWTDLSDRLLSMPAGIGMRLGG